MKSGESMRTRRPDGTATADMTAPVDLHASPPAFWDREIPRYVAMKNLWPTAVERLRFEPPQTVPADTWQFAKRPLARGDSVQTRCWPHPTSMRPLNYSAARVLQFLNSHEKSKLPWSPWQRDRVVLVERSSDAMRQNVSIDGDTAA